MFRLRKGVKFHDGTDFDAAAVAWNFERIMDKEEQAFIRPFFEFFEAVEPLDAHTVKFTLKYPTQAFLPTMAVYRMGFQIKSPTSYKTWGRKDAALHPLAPVPSSWPSGSQPDHRAREEPDYYKKGLPYLDRIELKIMKEG